VASFKVSEGPRTRVSAVGFAGNAALTAAQLERGLPLKRHDWFYVAAVAAVEDAVRERYLDAGFPFVQVEAGFTHENALAAVAVRVVEGPRCYIGEGARELDGQHGDCAACR
jgi:outer membrane protein assembly factor BamA